jgi:hypothetical protein
MEAVLTWITPVCIVISIVVLIGGLFNAIISYKGFSYFLSILFTAAMIALLPLGLQMMTNLSSGLTDGPSNTPTPTPELPTTPGGYNW